MRTFRASSSILGAAAALLLAATAEAQSGPSGYWKGDDGTTPTQAFNSVTQVFDGVYNGGATTSSSIPAALSATRSSGFAVRRSGWASLATGGWLAASNGLMVQSMRAAKSF